ncbi:cytoplasmic l-asparaginase i-like protein [Trypanosoma grayi]|uniref:cytoplasmic l-asparaginase i-like protein n=1 Tax=Trypanosoma grayi TaxID=71804 RepID=UPI0004F46B4E|nr:cytoplasmic l-asparaginase i-like protein [Trypanosoma grayi]KEG12403.1 cytoplasmic l-asparaginase i-like protein [Trypanosoma grayi]
MVKYVWGSESVAPPEAPVLPIDAEVDTGCEEVLLINTRSYALFDGDEPKAGEPTRNFLDILKENEDLQKTGVPRYHVVELDTLKHSAGQEHTDWIKLAHLVRDNYHKYRGFVVHNGTDNMVATATALSFMLENLGKPVVFTGARIPSERLYTDLKRNLILALLFANCSMISEVCILFDERLFRANRTIKISRSSLAPFDSPHFPPLATMDVAMNLHRPFLRLHPRGRFRVMDNMDAAVLCLKLGPAMRRRVFLRAVQLTEARAMIIIAYGGGNGPTRGDFMRNVIRTAVARDIVVVVCTQNLYGSVDLGAYEAGEQLLKAGAISARDMTIEATIMKLKYLLGVGLSSKEIKKIFSDVNLRGELSPKPANL